MIDQTNKLENSLTLDELKEVDSETRRSWQFQTYYDLDHDNLNPWLDIPSQTRVSRETFRDNAKVISCLQFSNLYRDTY